MKRLKGSELIFISQINRDGKGVEDVSKEDMSSSNNDYFDVHSLSITNSTHIACGFNSYVVKIKK